MSDKVLHLDLPVEFRLKQKQLPIKLGRQSAPSRIQASPSSAGIGQEAARPLEKNC